MRWFYFGKALLDSKSIASVDLCSYKDRMWGRSILSLLCHINHVLTFNSQVFFPKILTVDTSYGRKSHESHALWMLKSIVSKMSPFKFLQSCCGVYFPIVQWLSSTSWGAILLGSGLPHWCGIYFCICLAFLVDE